MNYIGCQSVEKLVAMVAQKNPNSDESTWYTDTSASHHITFEIGNLSLADSYNGTDTVMMGNGEVLSIQNIGNSTLLAGDNTFRLNNVLHCPSSHYNLLSVRRFAQDNSCFFQFDDNSFVIKDKTTRQVLHQGLVEGKMYPITFKQDKGQIQATSTKALLSTKALAQLWHHSLGHPSSNLLSVVPHKLKVPCSSYSLFECTPCQLGKSSQLPFPVTTSFTTAPLQILHCDL